MSFDALAHVLVGLIKEFNHLQGSIHIGTVRALVVGHPNEGHRPAQRSADARNSSQAKRTVMKILKMGVLAATAALVFGSVPGVASAAIVSGCTLNMVQVTSLTPVGTTNTQATAIGATQCIKIDGNDFAPRGRNLGELNDGLLNGEMGGTMKNRVSIGDPITFLNGRPPIDANRDGSAPTDPGWIYLGKHDDGKFDYGTVTSPFASKGTRSVSDFVKFEVTGSGTSGTWKLTPSATIVKDLTDFIGAGYFDSLAVILKASNEFVVYDLNFTGKGLDLTIPYVLTGTWNTGDMVNKKGTPHDLSHFSVWARDPEIMGTTTEIPEPTTLALLGLSLLGIGAASRRRKI